MCISRIVERHDQFHIHCLYIYKIILVYCRVLPFFIFPFAFVFPLQICSCVNKHNYYNSCHLRVFYPQCHGPSAQAISQQGRRLKPMTHMKNYFTYLIDNYHCFSCCTSVRCAKNKLKMSFCEKSYCPWMSSDYSVWWLIMEPKHDFSQQQSFHLIK